MSDLFSATSMYLVLEKPSIKGSAIKFEIGDGKNQVNLSLIYEIIQYVNGSKSESEFQDTLRTQLYNNLSQTDKDLIKKYKEYGANVSVIATKQESSVTDYQVKIGVPTDEYLKDLKYAEESDFKSRENHKHFKKMQKISGNTPLGELVVDISGTTIKPSNMHETDWNKLNDFKVQSPYFN